MVQLAVFAADPDGQKQQKKSWPIDESAMVELPLEDAPVTVVEVRKAGCCSRKCGVALTVIGVLLAMAIIGVALLVLSLAQPKPQESDVDYPDVDYYDSGEQHGGHQPGGHHGGHHGGQHDDDHTGGHHDGGHHSNPGSGHDQHDGWPIGGPHRPFPPHHT